MQIAASALYTVIATIFLFATYMEGRGTPWDRDRYIGLMLSAAWPIAIIGTLIALISEKTAVRNTEGRPTKNALRMKSSDRSGFD